MMRRGTYVVCTTTLCTLLALQLLFGGLVFAEQNTSNQSTSHGAMPLHTQEELIEASVAIAAVEVRLDALSHERVQLLGWIKSPTEASKEKINPVQWISICLPDENALYTMKERYPLRPQSAKLWDALLIKRRYQAVLFLRSSPKGLLPVCGTDALFGHHIQDHVEFQEWLKTLKSKLELAE